MMLVFYSVALVMEEVHGEHCSFRYMALQKLIPLAHCPWLMYEFKTQSGH